MATEIATTQNTIISIFYLNIYQQAYEKYHANHKVCYLLVIILNMPVMKFTGRHDSGKKGWQFGPPPPPQKKTFLDLNLKSIASSEIWRMFSYSFDWPGCVCGVVRNIKVVMADNTVSSFELNFYKR